MKKITLNIIIVILVIIGGVYLLQSNKTPDTNTSETSQVPVTSGENPEPGNSIHDLSVEPAAAEARKDLAVKLSVAEKSIVILSITEKTWTDGCLGLGRPEESCLQALVPGFRVEMLAQGKTYFYRTDKTGATIRAEI
jgi:hypothetical protein